MCSKNNTNVPYNKEGIMMTMPITAIEKNLQKNCDVSKRFIGFGPYQFLEQERWDRFRINELSNHPGTYLVILRKPQGYDISSGKHKETRPKNTCFEIKVSRNKATLHLSVSLDLEWVIRHQVKLSDFTSVFLIDAPKSIWKIEKDILQRNFFPFVLLAYNTLWGEVVN